MTSGMVNRWLLLVLQLPAQPSNGRVKTWRRLQQLGAVSVKNSVYVLPNSAQAVEDFEWLRSEIQGLKGQASIFTASAIDGLEENEIVEQFQAVRTEDYKQFHRDLERLRPTGPRARARTEDRMRALRQMRDRLTRIRDIDFFSAPGSQEAERGLTALERASRRTEDQPSAPATRLNQKDYKRRLWVTRPRPGVDRFASAWLISRFIDSDARFGFATDGKQVKGGVAFDMYETGFRHERDRCTFEVLQERFGVDDPIVRRIGEIVHDLDLKEDRFRAPQGAAVGALVEGLRAGFEDDQALLRQGVILFEALYRGLDRQKPSPRRTSSRAASNPRRKAGGKK
jgi:hypothetical protein